MDPPPNLDDIPLRQYSSTLSDTSSASNSTFVPSPTSPSIRRPGYHRVPTVAEADDVPSVGEVSSSSNGREFGLGIADIDDQKRSSVSNAPLGSNPTTSKRTSPASTKPLYSLFRDGESPYNKDAFDSSNDLTVPTSYQPFASDSERERLHQYTPSSVEKSQHLHCRSKKLLESGRGDWLVISMLTLSLYSTVFSGLWLFVAICKPRYGQFITKLRINPLDLPTIFQAIAKSIELSFVTVFIAVIGQILSKRALGDRRSITVAEMSMRSWVLQPGTMIAHWQAVRFAAVTYLGCFALLAALAAMLYTTASDALVTPKLTWDNDHPRSMLGKVANSFANKDAVESLCTTPIQPFMDVDHGSTCVQIQHSGAAFHNYMQYLGNWVNLLNPNNHSNTHKGSNKQTERPNPVAMLYDNTTIQGSWINVQNMTELFSKHQRIVNNVTMAMPHSGVIAAARDEINGIIQPEDLAGLGEYEIRASVPSPVVNVLCADISAEDLKPMVYNQWPKEFFNGTQPNSTSWPNQFNLTTMPTSLKKTAVDDLFGFDDHQVHPIFPKLPIAYNTVLNDSSIYGPVAIYLLANSNDSIHTYTMCSIKTAPTPHCSTTYHLTGSGAQLNTTCEDHHDRLAYNNSHPDAKSGMWQKDWKDVGSEWAKALSLNDGISDGQSSNARLLSQLIPVKPELDRSLPSISEALAVLAGNTLLSSSLGAPFVDSYNYTEAILEPPQNQSFKATIRIQDYQSGGQKPWQGIFYVVLAFIFLVNVCCFLYFIASEQLVTDFVEPQNLFCLSLLSPPSETLEGTCAGGPDKEHYNTRWNIKFDPSHEHVWLEGKGNKHSRSSTHTRRPNWSGSTQQGQFEIEGSPMARMYSRIRKKRSSML